MGSIPITPTIQSLQTADFPAGLNEADSGGISAGIVPAFRSPVTAAVSWPIFGLPSLHPKIPFPAGEFDGLNHSGIRKPCEVKPGL
jgi:hypothetical protein